MNLNTVTANLQAQISYTAKLVRYKQILASDKYDVVVPPVRPYFRSLSSGVGNYAVEFHKVKEFLRDTKDYPRPGIKVMFHVLDTGAVADNRYLNNRNQVIRDERQAMNWTGSKTRKDVFMHWSSVSSNIVGYHPEMDLGVCQSPGEDNWAYVLGQKVLNDDGAGYDRDIAKGAAHGFQVAKDNYPVSESWRHFFVLSLGAPRRNQQTAKILAEISETPGFFVFASAGNDGPPKQGISSVLYPAKEKGVFASGACDSQGRLAYFSAQGPEIDFVGAGVNNLGAWKNDYLVESSGTSFSNPVIAGLAAQIVRTYPWIKTRGELLETLSKYATDAGTKGKDNEFGHGIIKLTSYLGIKAPDQPADPDPDPDEPGTPDPDEPMPGEGSERISWTFASKVDILFRDHHTPANFPERELKGRSFQVEVKVRASDQLAGSEEVTRRGLEERVLQIVERYTDRAIVGKHDEELIEALEKLRSSYSKLQYSSNANPTTIAKEIAYRIREDIAANDRYLSGEVEVVLREIGGRCHRVCL